jgi:hypothetical protein
MADLTKIINIRVDFGKGKIDIDGVTSSLNKLNQAEQNLSKTLVGAVQPAYKRTEQSIRDQIVYQRQLQKAVEITSFEYIQYQRTIEGLQKELSTFQGQNSNIAGGFNGVRNSAGLASQTLVEVGRTISDANYGFTAVANNLSQLGYYFVSLVDQSKGFKNAVKDLGKQMLGAGGLIIAFQLVIFAIERFTLSQRESKQAVDEFNKSMSDADGQIATLENYAQIAQTATYSTSEQTSALKLLKKDGYDPLIGSIDDFIEAKKRLLIFNVQEKTLSQELSKVFQERYELEEAYAKEVAIWAEQGKTVSSSRTGALISNEQQVLERRKKIAESYGTAFAELDKKEQSLLTKQQTRFLSLTNELEDNPFFCLFFGDCSKAKGGGKQASFKFFNERLFDVAKLEERYRKKSLEDERITDEEKIKLDKANSIAELQILYNTYLEKQRLRYEDFVKERQAIIDSNKSTKQQREKAQIELADAEKTYNNQKIQAIKSFGLVVRQINKVEANEEAMLERRKTEQFLQILSERQFAELASVTALATNDLNRIDAGFELEKAKTAEKIRLIEQEKEIRLKANQDTYIQDQQIAKETEALNQKRLLAFEQGEQAKLAIANQVGEAIIAIAGEGSAVGKAVAVAMATMNTYEAVTAALGSKPYGPWNIAQAAAVAAMGFVQVRNILKTEVPSPKGGAGGGAAAGVTINPPDFNIVGQSASNQLASAVQGQFNQPVKAYVVSKDVSTAQEMDRNIVATASLG